MLRIKRRLLTVLCMLALCGLSPAATAAPAEPAAETVTARQWNHDVWVDNLRVDFANEHGRNALLFIYQGTVYVPLRTAGEWMGCDVVWEQGTQTVHLRSGGEPVFLTSGDVPPLSEEELAVWSAARSNGIEIQIRPDISVVLDGEAQHFTNAKGNPVYPAFYRQMTYLPIRSIGALCGFTVAWAPAKANSLEAIYLHSPLSDAEAAEIRAFVSQGAPIADQVYALAGQLVSGEDDSDAAGMERFAAVLDCLAQLRTIPQPTALCAKDCVSRLNLWIRETESAVNFHMYLMESGAESFAEIQDGILLRSDMMSGAKNLQAAFSILRDATPDLW